METIKIKFSRKKIVLILLLCFAFSFLCWNLVVDPGHYTSYRYRDPGFIFLGGLFGLILCGAGNLVLLKMLFRRNPALIIDEKGITDYSTFMSVGLIHWEDIIVIKEGKVQSTRFITIHIKNKKKYLALSKNAWQTYMMKMNSKYFRSPIHINSSGLQCKHDELIAIILKAYETYKYNSNPVRKSGIFCFMSYFVIALCRDVALQRLMALPEFCRRCTATSYGMSGSYRRCSATSYGITRFTDLALHVL